MTSKVFNFSLRTLILLALTLGAAGLTWFKREPWRLSAVLQSGDENLHAKGALSAFNHGPAIAWSSNQPRLLTIWNRAQLSIWDTSAQRLIETWDFRDAGYVDVTLSPNGSTAILSFDFQRPWIVDLKSGTRVATLESLPGRSFRPSVSSDSRFVIAATHENVLTYFDIATGKQTTESTPDELLSFDSKTVLWRHVVPGNSRSPGELTPDLRNDFWSYAWQRVGDNSMQWGICWDKTIQGWRRCREDGWKGFFQLPELWLALALLGATVFSLLKDRRDLARRTPAV